MKAPLRFSDLIRPSAIGTSIYSMTIVCLLSARMGSFDFSLRISQACCCSFRRNTAFPATMTPCCWKTRLAMSKPTVVISIVDGSFSSLHSTARAWHIDAVRGRPPHQISSVRCAAGMPSGPRLPKRIDYAEAAVDDEAVLHAF